MPKLTSPGVYVEETWYLNGKPFQRPAVTLWGNGQTVTLQGPSRRKITLYGINATKANTNVGAEIKHLHELFSYVLDIPENHSWTYEHHTENYNQGRIGTNDGYVVTVEPAGAEIPPGCSPPETDIPCNIAVADLPNLGEFFPSTCEPCRPGTPWSLPPGTAPTLAIPPAAGGCVRPRFFNGMFITSEDMETLLRWTRVKQQMQNRAMGQGVVWGLNVDRDGHHIRVHPGYAVDCCGNDLVVTTPYCVDINTLMRDPAATPGLAGPEPHRMHLLLEYHECPEEPRPVHGDPCTPEVNSCEMSRMRETVRLRLVLPRDYQPNGPIGAFLDDLTQQVSEHSDLASLLEEGQIEAPGVATESTVRPQALDSVPYVLELRFAHIIDGAQQFSGWHPIDVSMDNDVDEIYDESWPSSNQISLEDAKKYSRLEVRIRPLFGMTLADGVVLDDENTELSQEYVTSTSASIWLRFPLQDATRSLSGSGWVAEGLKFSVQGLRVDSHIASFRITISLTYSGRMNAFLFQVQIPPVEMAFAPPEPPSLGCFGEGCAEHDAPLFAVFPPWAHEHPLRSGHPADPTVLALAAAYTWLVMENARHQADTAEEVNRDRERLAEEFQSLLRGILGMGKSEHLTALARTLSETLNRLLCAWCESFLYPGPQCQGEPHGVVIGCVRVEGGDIAQIDPWGGRRYVVHYPLIAHWGEQLGIVPPDVMVSRVMTLICCVANLPLPVASVTTAVGYPSIRSHEESFVPAGGGRMVAVGPNLLRVGARAEEGEAEFHNDVTVIAGEPLSPIAFINRLVTGLRNPVTGRSRFYRRHVLRGSSNLVVYEPVPAPISTPPSERELEEERLAEIVRADMAGSEAAVPGLLQDFTRELTMALLRATPLDIEDDSVTERLTAAGVTSVGSVLSRTRSNLHERILERRHARTLNRILRDSDGLALAVARAVSGAVSDLNECDVNEVEDLENSRNLGELVDRLAQPFEAEPLATLGITSEDLSRVTERVVRCMRSRH